jgi:hypothetical protein
MRDSPESFKRTRLYFGSIYFVLNPKPLNGLPSILSIWRELLLFLQRNKKV